MALYPAPDMTSGAVSLWVAGAEQAERAAALVRELGHTVSVLGSGSSVVATRFDPSGPLRGTLRPPADKSISHRAALIAAMGEGETTIEGYLDAADTRSTLAAVEALGAQVEGLGATGIEPTIRVRGVGLRGPRPASDRRRQRRHPAAAAAGLAGRGRRRGAWTLDGDDSIRRRPVDRIVEPLRQMGARLRCREERLPPLEIEGAPLHGIAYELPVASAQVKSCLLFAGLLAEGETRGDRAAAEPRPHRAHARGGRRRRSPPRRRRHACGPAERLEPGEIVVPADFSSAAFFIVAALLVPGSDVTLAGVGLNPTRTGLLAILERMGAEIEVEPEGERGGEPIGRVRVRPAELRGAEVGGADVPLAIDELPLVALAACFAEGTTTIRDAAELRRKESDRIATVTEALTALGGRVEATEDGMDDRGRRRPARRHDRLPRRPPDRDAGRHRRPRLARGRRGRGHGRRRGQLPGLRGRPRLAAGQPAA